MSLIRSKICVCKSNQNTYVTVADTDTVALSVRVTQCLSGNQKRLIRKNQKATRKDPETFSENINLLLKY